MNKVNCYFLVSLIVGGISSCSQTKIEKNCSPGATQGCDCAGGLKGVQICLDDGVKWGSCASCGNLAATDGGITDIAHPGVNEAVNDNNGKIDGRTSTVETTIKNIKQGNVPDKSTIVLSDVVITVVDGYGQYTGDVYVQDPAGGEYSGIKLYRPIRLDGNVADLVPGDHIKVEGTLKYWSPSSGFNDTAHPHKQYVMEIDVWGKITKLTAGTAPSPKVLTVDQMIKDPDAEKWENVLVRIEKVAVMSDLNTASGEFTLRGGLTVDDELYPYNPKLHDCLTVTGISNYSYEYKLLPRNDADFQTATGCP